MILSAYFNIFRYLICLPLTFCDRAYFHAMHVTFTSEPDNRNKPVMMETDKTAESQS